MTDFIPKGIAHVSLAGNAQTAHFSFLLQSQFSMLAFSAAIEPLRIANQLTERVLYRWETISKDGLPVRCSNGTELAVDVSLADARPDSSLLVCSGIEPEKQKSKVVSDWIRRAWREGRTVGGLCTGAYALAHAGILENRSFTLHWENLEPFRERFPRLGPLEQLYAFDGRIITCGGGGAATDMMVNLIRDQHGAHLSDVILNMCLHQSTRPPEGRQRSATSAILATRHPRFAGIVEYMHDNLEDDIQLKKIADRFEISLRQMERLFSQYTATSPKQYLIGLRLERGRALLADTNLSVAEITAAVGFTSSSHFSKRFAQKFGISPYKFSMSRVGRPDTND